MVFILTFYLNNDLLSTGLVSHFYVPENHTAELNQLYLFIHSIISDEIPEIRLNNQTCSHPNVSHLLKDSGSFKKISQKFTF